EDVVARMDDEELANCVNMLVFDDMQGSVEGGTGVGGFKGTVRGEGAEFWFSEKYAIPRTPCADGPSGVRLSIFGEDPSLDSQMARTTFAFPCGTALAQAWDPAAAESLGRCAQSDLELSGVSGWLAPGLNLHRNPLCGRNFEYFSEDPLIAGRTAAGVVRGVQTREDGTPSGRYATVKHFCTNNQETERGREENVVSERALRELYLRAFRFACDEGRPLALMTSYNRLDGDWVATTRPLLAGVLRGEWGWDGVVMTDWWNAADNLRHQTAGNDVIAPGVAAKRDLVRDALRDGRIPRGAVQASAVRVLRLVAHCARHSANGKDTK
ncbi:MAG: beta-glucosidase, partial [Kiritimatiellae bacterium]|nr:beta-glucosidase [Kiritimatiellia bacterium]